MDATTERLVRSRARECCEYCRLPQWADPVDFEIDHIVSLKHRGASNSENLALACFACNRRKGPNVAGIDPESDQVVRLFHPRRDVWSEHFEWHGAKLVGLTAIGRATIEVLEINLPHRIALRAALMAEKRQ